MIMSSHAGAATTGSGIRQVIPPKHQADIAFSQAAPVQNTWYTALDTTLNVNLISVGIQVADTNETLESRLTIDGVVYSGTTQAAVAGTRYYLFLLPGYSQWKMGTTNLTCGYYTPLMSRSIKIEYRKTTAAGAGTISGVVVYQKW